MAKKKKSKLLIAWIAVSASLVVLSTVGTTVSYNVKSLSKVFDNLWGGDKTLRASESGSFVLDEGITDKASALANANDVNKTTCEEGFVLLKNENKALPLKTPTSDNTVTSKPKISVFGKNSVDLAYGGSGSGGGNSGGARTIYEALEEAGYDYNKDLQSFYKDKDQSGSGRPESLEIEAGIPTGFATGETPVSSYSQSLKSTFANYNDMALVVISRTCGEGNDVPTAMKDSSGNPVTGAYAAEDHYLELDKNEQEMIQMVCENFSKVVLVINSSQTFELGFLDSINDNDETMINYDFASKIQAAIWIGGPGGSGIMALGEILNGSVNPSGKTVDTYARDFTKNPVYNNLGYKISSKESSDTYLVGSSIQEQYYSDYEEGIYVGYKYYETRAKTDGETWYQNNVIYPFGYGLSYTEFKWSVTNKAKLDSKELTKDSEITVEVKVDNIGDEAGKDVVELFVRTPYTNGEIEKADKVLCSFAKTDKIAKDGSDTVSLTFNAYDIASYDYNDANKNNNKGYELDAGSYEFFVSKDAHTVVDSFTMEVKNDILFEKSTEDGIKVENQFDDIDDQLGQKLSRTDWEGTWPQKRTTAERTVDSDYINKVKSTATNNPLTSESEEVVNSNLTVAKTKKKTGVQLPDLYGLEYEDEKWDELLENMTISTMLEIREHAAFGTDAVDYITKPRTIEPDGPVGFTQFMGGGGEVSNTCLYASEAVMGSTWNVSQAKAMGVAVGNEALIGTGKGEAYTGWYAPGINLHRSPFGGRNYEYYSEDPILSGLLAANEIEGVSSKGVVTYMKHFAVNENEMHRNGVCTWLTEQTLREQYLKPFEIAITKSNGGAKGVMSSFNRIGTTWTGGDYRLLTTVLRDEWGFKGTVISDFSVSQDYMNTKQMAYAGGDINLTNYNMDDSWVTTKTATNLDIYVLKKCTKNYLYSLANSNAMNGLVPEPATLNIKVDTSYSNATDESGLKVGDNEVKVAADGTALTFIAKVDGTYTFTISGTDIKGLSLEQKTEGVELECKDSISATLTAGQTYTFYGYASEEKSEPELIYVKAPWKKALTGIDIGIGAFVVLSGVGVAVYLVLKNKKEKEQA